MALLGIGFRLGISSVYSLTASAAGDIVVRVGTPGFFNVGNAYLSIAVLVSQAVVSAVPRIGNYMPGKLLGWGTNLIAGRGGSYWWALGVTIGVIVFCLYFAQRLLENKDL